MDIEELRGVPDTDRRPRRSHGSDIDWSDPHPKIGKDAVHHRRLAAVKERKIRWNHSKSESHRITF